MSDWEWTLTIETGHKGGPGSGHHGHAGRPGQRGGSAPGKGGGRDGRPGRGGKPARVAHDTYNDEGGMAVLNGKGAPSGNIQVDHFLEPSDEQLADIKNEICTELSERTGLPYDTTKALVKTWAGSSADLNTLSLQLQEQAAKEFGLTLRPSITERLQKMGGKKITLYSSLETLGVSEAQARGFLRAMYDSTQERFAKNGIKEITLFRGSKSFAPHNGTDVRLSGNPMQSFSIDAITAHDFGGVAAMTVPVSSIISSARTGFGCLAEGEFVVLVGADSDHVIKVLP